MWIKQLFLGLIGFSGGIGVAGGIFALIIGLGVIPRFAGRTHTGRHIMLYESCIMAGGIVGNLIFIYEISLPLGVAGLILLGLFGGIFVGSWSMALAEIVNTIPIFARRIRLKEGLGLMILGMAFGKTLGSLLYFFNRW